MDDKLKQIKQLIECYLKGETSVEEENRLNEFFCQSDIPEEFIPYRQMFHIVTEPNDTPDDQLLESFADNNGVKKKHSVRILPIMFRIATIAAVAILIFMAGYQFNNKSIPQPIMKERIVRVTTTVQDTVRERIPVIITKTINHKVYIAVTPKQNSGDARTINSKECDVASIDTKHSAATVSRTLFSGTSIDVNAEFGECAKAQAQFENKEMKNYIKTLGYEVNN